MCQCCRAQVSCCCGSEPCSLCCGCLPAIKQSISTRMMYTFFLLIATLVCCVMLSPDVQVLMASQVPLFNETCVTLQAGENCNRLIGYMAVYRICFTMVVFHIVMTILVFWVADGNGCRAGLHNGFWGLKLLALIGICIGSFYIPGDDLFGLVWMYVGMVGGTIFIILQLILLVDFAHHLHSKMYGRAGGFDGKPRSIGWNCALYFLSTLMMTLSIGAAVLLYVFYTQHEACIKNKLFIAINGILCIMICVMSVLPCTRRMNMNSGLLQGTLISLYVIYLTWSAMISEPRIEVQLEHVEDNSTYSVTKDPSDPIAIDEARFDKMEVSCSPMTVPGIWQLLSGYVGAALMLVMAVYASLMTSHRAKRLGIQTAPKHNEVCCCQGSRTGSQGELIRGGQPVANDEYEQVVYSYSFFHFMFALGSLYIMMQLTMWYKPEGSVLKEYGRNWPSVWVKMASSWVCVLIYLFTLFVPRCLPGRDYSHVEGMDATAPRRRHSGTLV